MHPCSFSQPQKRKGVIIDVGRRSLSADRAPFSLSSPALTRPRHPFPAFPTFLPSTIHCNLLLSLPVNLSPSLSSSFFLPLSNITPLFGCFFFLPTHSSGLRPLFLLFLFLHSHSFSLQQCLTQIYISSAVIDIFYLPASFPVGCQPASPRQLQWVPVPGVREKWGKGRRVRGLVGLSLNWFSLP